MTESRKMSVATTLSAGVGFFKDTDIRSDDCLHYRRTIQEAVKEIAGDDSNGLLATFMRFETGWGLFGSSSLSSAEIAEKKARIERMKVQYEGKCRGQIATQPSPAPEAVKGEVKRVMLPQFNPTYGVSAEVLSAVRPSALGLFARDVANAAEQFSDTMVATAAHDAKVVGQFAKDVIAPVAIGAALVYGLAKMVETGDTSVVQRAWAMVR